MKPNAWNGMSNPEAFGNPMLHWLKWIVLILLTFMAIGLLAWSFWPIPVTEHSISLPETYVSPVNDMEYQFPYQQEMVISYPTYIRYGDVAKMHVQINTGDKIVTSFGNGCSDFCRQKQPIPQDIRQNYYINLLFDFDQNNLQLDPPGDTSFSLSTTIGQQFTWQIQPVKRQPAYIKTTFYLEIIEKQGNAVDRVPVFAKEIPIPVHSIGSMKVPVIRILSLTWIFAILLINLIRHLVQRAEQG
jgi:hypothetical protein